MTYKNNTISTPYASLVTAPTVGEADPTRCFPPLDIRLIVSNLLAQDPITILVAVPSNIPVPDSTNTPFDPTEAFKTIVSEITYTLPYLIAPISYEPETVLPQMEFIKKGLIDATNTYK